MCGLIFYIGDSHLKVRTGVKVEDARISYSRTNAKDMNSIFNIHLIIVFIITVYYLFIYCSRNNMLNIFRPVLFNQSTSACLASSTLTFHVLY